MALPELKSDRSFAPPAPKRPLLREASVHARATPSPARELHERLHRSVGYMSADERWSYARRIVFILTTASGLWATLIVGGVGIARLVA